MHFRPREDQSIRLPKSYSFMGHSDTPFRRVFSSTILFGVLELTYHFQFILLSVYGLKCPVNDLMKRSRAGANIANLYSHGSNGSLYFLLPTYFSVYWWHSIYNTSNLAVLIQRCDRDSEFLIASRLLCFRSGCQIMLEYWPGDLESAIDKYFHLISSWSFRGRTWWIQREMSQLILED